MLLNVIDYISNVIDFCLFLLLVHKQIKIHAPQKKHIAYTLCSLLFYLLLKAFPLPTSIVLLLFLSSQIIYIRSISAATFSEAMFLGSAFVSVVMIADEVTYFIFSILEYEHLADLENVGIYRLAAMLVYYPLLLFGTWMLSNLRFSRIHMPLGISILSYFTVFLGIYFFYSQIDMTVELSQTSEITPQIVASSMGSCILLILFFLLLLAVIICAGKLYSENQLLLLREAEAEHESKQYQTYADTYRLLRGWRHDSRNQLLTLSELAKNKNWNALTEYLDELLEPSEQEVLYAATGNLLIDSMLNTKQTVAKEHGIIITRTIYLPEQIPVSQVELSSLVGNLLDNAIEACLGLHDGADKTVHLQIKPNRGSLLISVDNPSNGHYIKDANGVLLSTKNETGHGIGLERIRYIVEEHNGYIQILPERNSFTVRIMLPLPSASAAELSPQS